MRSLLHSDNDSDTGSHCIFLFIVHTFLFISASVSFVHDGVHYS